jgi:hypothetical protein
MQSRDTFRDALGDWVKGLRLFPGTLSAAVIRKVIARMAPQLNKCLAAGEYIDIWQCAESIGSVSGNATSLNEIIEAFLMVLPPFQSLPPPGKRAFVETYICLEEKYSCRKNTFVGQSVGIQQ